MRGTPVDAHAWQVAWIGDSAFRLEVPGPDPLAANTRVHALAARLRTAAPEGVRGVVPGLTSLTVHVVAPRVDLGAVLAALEGGPAGLDDGDVAEGRTHVIRVRYGGGDGPDLDEVARTTGLTQDEVVTRHRALTYRVCFLGFLPGFAYLGMLPAALRLPRRATPRVRVPAGSVAIADTYTGIYPTSSPGGWHLIGRADVALFDAGRAQPSLMAPGDQVRFVPA